eukprot:gene2859-4702_t
MHDRKREKIDSKTEEIIKLKIKKYCELKEEILEFGKELKMEDNSNEKLNEILLKTSKILLINPEFYSLWNYRKEVILKLKDNYDLKNELKLTEELLKSKGIKSYSVWLHREWCIKRLPEEWENELKLCSKLLKLDERNFHCWNYRRNILELSSTEKEKDLKFIKNKIESNPSNYSAWHNRSYLVEKTMDEFDIVRNAFYTLPNDQSAWIYHLWLLENNEIKEIDIETCNDLLEIEPNCKWALITLIIHNTNLNENISKLIKLDSNHIGYYYDILSDFKIKQSNNCLNLNNQNLTRFNSCNSFNSLIHLNLKNNKIKFIPILNNLIGLESLNLENNEIKYLENLNYLKKLKSLNLNNNKIEYISFDQEILSNSLIEIEIKNNPINEEMNDKYLFNQLKQIIPNLKE